MFTSITDDYEPLETGPVHPNRRIFFSKSISECALLLAQCKIKFALKYHLTKAQTSWNIQRSLILKFTFPKFISAFSFFPIGLRRDKKVSQGRSIAIKKTSINNRHDSCDESLYTGLILPPHRRSKLLL